jgi:transposase
MIVIGVDPHKQTHTAAAVDRSTGELLGELTVKGDREGHARLLEWARELGSERGFALEDCRQVSCRLAAPARPAHRGRSGSASS